MTADDKPREIWTIRDEFSNRALIRDDSEKWPNDVDGKPGSEWTHYIKASAYDALKKERDELKASNDLCISRGLHESRMKAVEAERDRLAAENKRMREALEQIEKLDDEPRLWGADDIARECLESLK